MVEAGIDNLRMIDRVAGGLQKALNREGRKVNPAFATFANSLPSFAVKDLSPQFDKGREVYLLLSGTSPRNFIMGSTDGLAPRHASYIFSRSSVLPRESTILRNRSPFARVSPP